MLKKFFQLCIFPLIVIGLTSNLSCTHKKLDFPTVRNKYKTFYKKKYVIEDTMFFSGNPAVNARIYTKKLTHSKRQYVYHNLNNKIYGSYYEFIKNDLVSYVFYLGTDNCASYNVRLYPATQTFSINFGSPFVDRIGFENDVDSVWQLISKIPYDNISLTIIDNEKEIPIKLNESIYFPYVYAAKIPKIMNEHKKLKLQCYIQGELLDVFIKQGDDVEQIRNTKE